jgi:Putative esterase
MSKAPPATPKHQTARPGRRSVLALLASLGSGCGGGGDVDTAPRGSRQLSHITSRHTGTGYPIHLYLPPDSEGVRGTLPVVYLLDGDSRFTTMVELVEASRSRVIVAAIGNEALRARDYVPMNSCTTGGGGHVAFFNFIRHELIPHVESTIGGHPGRRILLGHSHGGSFVLFAAFNEAAGSHHFSAYLASDASVGCMRDTVYGWESAYASANPTLPVRLHLAYASNVDNIELATHLQGRRYGGLTLAAQAYAGGHVGMIPLAFAQALAFALG